MKILGQHAGSENIRTLCRYCGENILGKVPAGSENIRNSVRVVKRAYN
jgi:hypothetical protein